MPDEAEQVAEFISVTNSSRNLAEQYLRRNNNDIVEAIEDYYANNENKQFQQQQEEEEEEEEEEEARKSDQPRSQQQHSLNPLSRVRAGAPTSSSSKKTKRNAGGITTFRDLNQEDEDSEDDSTNQNFFTGGEKSALQVEDPNKDRSNNKKGQSLIDQIFQRARDQIDMPDDRDSARAPQEEQERTVAFSGTGFKLGDGSEPSEVIEDPNAQTRRNLLNQFRPKKVNREITFWKQGFTVGESQLYSYDDPKNQRILYEIEQGRVPIAILEVELGDDVDVTVSKRTDEDYVPPKKKIGGYHGAGQRLGSPVPGEGISTSQAEEKETTTETETATETATMTATSSASTTETKGRNTKGEGEGDSLVQIRFANGKRVSQRFNSYDPITLVYDFVRNHEYNRDNGNREFTLSHSFPVKPIEENSEITVSDAKLKNAVINDIPVPQSQFQTCQNLEDLIRDYYTEKSRFKNSFAQIDKQGARNVDIDPFPHFDPVDFPDILHASRFNVPQLGSVVEFIQNNTRVSEIGFGVVVQDSAARFDERFNHVLVLTASNEIVQVKPLDIKFHLHKVIPDGYIDFESIILQRHRLTHSERTKAIQFIGNFIQDALFYKRRLSPHFGQVFGQFSQDQIVPLSILDVIDSLRFVESDILRISQSYYYQCVFLLGIHWNLIDSCMFLVPNYVGPSVSNVVLWQHSNNYSSTAQYFVNTEQSWQSIFNFLQSMSSGEDGCDESFVTKRINDFIASAKQMTKAEMKVYFEVFEGRYFVDFINALKFAVMYPHDSIINQLRKLDVFQYGCSPASIYSLLVDLKAFSFESSKYPDMLYASGIFGKTTKDAGIQTPSVLFTRDNFKHLRNSKRYYKDHTIYGLLDEVQEKDKDTGSSFGISMESLNSRKHVVNIHIPDIITRIQPGGNIFRKIFNHSGIIQSSILFPNGISNGLFSDAFKRQMSFQNYTNYDVDEEIWNNSSDFSHDKRVIPNYSLQATCLTVSFQFSSFLSNPFESLLGKVSISFDSLAGVSVKNVTKDQLQKCLTGQLEPSFFKFLRRHKQQQQQQKQQLQEPKQKQEQEQQEQQNTNAQNNQTSSHLNKADIHNLNYIYNILQTFFKTRVHAGSNAMKSSPDSGVVESFDPGKASLQFLPSSSPSPNAASSNIFLSSSSYTQAEFMIQEARILANYLTTVFCDENKIPVIRTGQDKDTLEYEKDSVIVHHDNIMIPPFEAKSYFQSIMAKDVNGHITPNAKIISNNYLQPVSTNLSASNLDFTLGLDRACINITDTFNSGEVLMNQLQLLSHVQERFSNETMHTTQDLLASAGKFNFVKGEGYLLNGPLDTISISEYVRNLQKFKKADFLWKYTAKRFRVLEKLQKLQNDNDDSYNLWYRKFSCIVTHVDHCTFGKLWKAFCLELGIEVDILCIDDRDAQIGDKVICDEIIHLDPVSGTCLLISVPSI
ncbi:hypothetical protein KGF56_002336 [Candida oxycetoniae]|uniref:UBX domain-containing protein n=1 Tax=Candida oxycetoniae TaxID=497107 RepID=A0AAI9WYA4_9ASCO|nr:uncharacterized protein KGF56_002336 [Candida oxycetoniae]KAI3404819.2 hypothetical protein KGF56_002336 [Candida oxycetoniae]